MAEFEVKLSDGRIVEIDAPDAKTAARAASVYERRGGGKPKRGLVDDITGVMATINSRIPLADEFAAAGQTGVNLMTGRVPLGEAREDFDRSLAKQRGYEADLQRARPRVAALSRGTGDALVTATPTGKVASTFANGSRALNATRGAVTAGATGALMAATDRGTAAERLQAASSAATNPMLLTLGAAGGALAPARGTLRDDLREALPDDLAARIPQPKPRAPNTRKADAAILKDIGVETSIPQRMGGMPKQVEDLAMRAPILGPAVSGARGRQVEQLNRGVALKALRPVGKTVPKEIQPGFEMVEYVDEELGKVYDDAAKLAPRVTLDEQLLADAEKIGARRVDLADSEAALWDKSIADRLNRLQSGEASGELVKKIHEELGGLQVEHARKGNTTLSSMFGEARRAIMGLVERASPEAGEMIRKADEGWSVYSMMNDAAAQATNRGGVFLPGQLNTQVRSAAKRMGSNMAGKGKGPLQDIATAASRTLPDQFGNPGTANAVGLGGLMMGSWKAPAETVAVAGGLSVAATPYWLMARKVIEELPEAATKAQLTAADEQLARLAASDPAVAALRREVAARLAVGAGVQAGALQRGELMTQGAR